MYIAVPWVAFLRTGEVRGSDLGPKFNEILLFHVLKCTLTFLQKMLIIFISDALHCVLTQMNKSKIQCVQLL